MKRIAILLLASILVLSLTYCKSTETPDASSTEESLTVPNNIYDPDTSSAFLEALDTYMSHEGNASSDNIIEPLLESALLDGDIDETDYNVYTIWSALAPENLPDAYAQTSIDYDIDIQGAVGQLLSDWYQLSDDVKASIEPFLLPITDEKSYFNPNIQTTGQLPKGRVAYAAGNPDNFVLEEFHESGLYDISFSYYTSGNWSEAIANSFRAGFDGLIEEFEYILHLEADLMVVYPDKAIVVEFVPLQAGLGWAYDYEDHYYIKINSNIITNPVLVRATFSHELFHCFQYTKGIHSSTDALKWAMESTASWAMHYCYENDNVEHRFLNYFESNLEKQRVSSLGKNEYASYMLFYYLTDYMGEDALIRNYMDYVAANPNQAGSHLFFENQLSNYLNDWPVTYGDFAVSNLNLQGHEVYRDNGLMDIAPEGNCYVDKYMTNDEEQTVQVSLAAGGIQYYQFDFSDDTDFISFTFDDEIQSEMVYRQAYIQFDGQWRLEDWSEVTDKDYWKKSDDISEHVETVILIYSNGHMSNPATNCDRFTVTTYKAIDAIQIDAIYRYETDQGGIVSIATIREEVKPYMGFLYMTTDYEYTVETTISTEDGSVISSGSVSGSLFEDPNLNNSFPRIILPMSGNNQQLADSLAAVGIGDIASEFGYLILIPYSEETVFGTTTLALPAPVGTTEIEGALPNMGLILAGGVMLPKDIKDGPMDETMTINLSSHHNPLTSLFEIQDFSALMANLNAMNAYASMPDMPDIPDMGDLPGMADIPGMPTSGSTAQIMDAIQAYMNANLGTLELRIRIEMD